MNYLFYIPLGRFAPTLLAAISAAVFILGAVATTKAEGLSYSGLTVSAIQRTITGKVVGATDSLPLTGVSVAVKETSRGTTTDENGHFSIEASEGEVLVFSYLGYKRQEINVGNQPVLDVVLASDDAETLDEVVVVGYGTQRRKEVTSAVATVRAEDFNAGGARSPLDLIQGKVAGLSITRTQGNNPNSSAAIQLRGITSITGSRAPLIVIDGIPGGSLDLLQQDDIESFDVLKDGSAAAIYGTRANAGVILITTKKGREGPPRFDYSTYMQREVVDRKPDFLTAADFRDLIAQGLINSDQDFGASTDLYEELIDRQNMSHYHNFAASGGSANTNYRASIFFNDAKGIAKQSNREQWGGRININQRGLQDRLSLQVNLAANLSKSNLLGGGFNNSDDPNARITSTGADFEQAVQRNPTAPIYNEDGTFLETQGYNNYNPVSRLANRIAERNQQVFSGDARLTLDIVEGLSATAFGSYVRNNFNDRFYRSTNDWEQREASEWQGMAYAAKWNDLSWIQTFESTIDYNTTFASDHSFTALLGYSYQYGTTERFNVNNNGFTTDGFLDWNLGAGSAIQNTALPRPGMGSFKDDNTLVAFFGRVNYAYQGKYMVQAILRREGSSRFGANHKWGNFPSVSAGWTLSEEPFLQDVPQINELKLRVGYGVTGNQGIPNYQSLLTLGTGGVYPQEGVYYQTYGPSRNPNPNLRWEQKAEWNFGLDFALFNNRISGALDVYDRETKDLLYNYNAQQPAFVRDLIYTNVGSIRNYGVELQLSAVAIQRDDFRWNIDFAGNTNANKLTKLSSELFQANWLEFGGLPSPGNLGNAIRLEEGGAIGNFYGKRFAGFTDDGEWLFFKADGSTGSASDMNENDLTVIGNGVPKYNASLSNTFVYKNFDLTIFFRGKFGFDILNTQDLYFGNKRWLPNNLLRSAITTHNQLNDDPQYSDYYIERGDFVKLDNLTLGYTFPFNSSYVRNMRIYITGRNIATITGYSGIDPELQDTGFETGIDTRGFYPRTQSWALGLIVGF
ncbi:TonB-linked outer membrane protein, SusC/RagA family [Parapedobacter composti]|uniref:TonB-linked outer membrane protein, SusC/RagA family n=1 Tax=Parapedobacter composti TaxID=623281 RepID=A0A1I1DYN4_9SPHI|nr:TonB-dependent receptor [Parapedobacter composti]SFB80149.1 TonB-linked outer membrane protein, SusC/RagA family [Parapedobacter composti]